MVIDDEITSSVRDDRDGLSSHVSLRVVEGDEVRQLEERPVPPQRPLRRMTCLLRQAPSYHRLRDGLTVSISGVKLTATVRARVLVVVVAGHLHRVRAVSTPGTVTREEGKENKHYSFCKGGSNHAREATLTKQLNLPMYHTRTVPM